MATSGIGGIGTGYNFGYNSGYNSGMDYDSWVNDANQKADELKDKYTSDSYRRKVLPVLPVHPVRKILPAHPAAVLSRTNMARYLQVQHI